MIHSTKNEIIQNQGIFNLVVEKGLNFTFFQSVFNSLFFQYKGTYLTTYFQKILRSQFTFVNSMEHEKRNRN